MDKDKPMAKLVSDKGDVEITSPTFNLLDKIEKKIEYISLELQPVMVCLPEREKGMQERTEIVNRLERILEELEIIGDRIQI